jgi:hypothetical protein
MESGHICERLLLAPACRLFPRGSPKIERSILEQEA